MGTEIKENQKVLASTASSLQTLAWTALPLVLRGFVIAGCQHLGKRAILAHADESMLATYGIYSGIEGFIFILIFRGLRIVSKSISDVHARENDPGFQAAEIGETYRRGVAFGFVLLIPAGLLCVMSPWLFRWTGQSEMVLAHCVGFFIWSFLAYFFDMLYRSRARVDIGLSNAVPVLMGDISESVLDVVLTYLFVNGKGGMPKMGVTGAAVAYALASFITTIGYHLRSYLNSNFDKYHLYDCSDKKLLSPEFQTLCAAGFHIAFRYSILYITLMVTTFLCGFSGPGAIAGLQAAGAYSYLVTLPIAGLSEAATVIIARLYQQNKWDEAKKIGNEVIFLSVLFSFFCAGMLFTFMDPVSGLFIDSAVNKVDFQIVKQFLCIQAVMDIGNSMANAGASVLVGCGETHYPFLMSVWFIFKLNLLLALTAYFGFSRDAVSMYAVQTTGLILNAIAVLVRWMRHEPENASIDTPVIVSTAKNRLFCESPRMHKAEMELPLPKY